MFTVINMSRDHITSYFRQHGVDLLLLEKVPCKKITHKWYKILKVVYK